MEQEKTENLEHKPEQQEIQEKQDIPDHPADRLMVCFEEVEEQEKRLTNRRSGDLKYELVNNVYPIIKQIISAVLDFMDDFEQEPEITEESEHEIMKVIEQSIENCKYVVNLCEYLEKNKIELPEEMRARMSEVVSWARTTIENSNKIQK